MSYDVAIRRCGNDAELRHLRAAREALLEG
jgi:hypothetical protein